jgi:hypothetical protein
MAVMRDLVAVGMPAAAARLFGTDGANGAPMMQLMHVGIPAALAKLLGSDTSGSGKSTPIDILCAAGMPPAQARLLGV